MVITQQSPSLQHALSTIELQAQRQKPQSKKSTGLGKQKHVQQNEQHKSQETTTIADCIDEYLRDHEGGNHSSKTLEWHSTALNLLRRYLEEEEGITCIEEVGASNISAWFTSMRKTPGARSKIRSERTIQTYARSARAFFHWLIHRGTLELNPFDRVVCSVWSNFLKAKLEPF